MKLYAFKKSHDKPRDVKVGDVVAFEIQGGLTVHVKIERLNNNGTMSGFETKDSEGAPGQEWNVCYFYKHLRILED